MRTIVLMLCLALLGGTLNLATAQDQGKQKPTAQEMATKKMAKLTETLKLTADQQKQVHAMVLEHAEQREQVNNTKLTQDERHNQMKELRTNFDAQLKGILTPDQLELYQAHKEEMRKNKQGQHNHNCCGKK
jgi:hypothetical protein